MDLPLILSGPILRRVEPMLVSVWVALREACTIQLLLWEGHSIQDNSNAPLFSQVSLLEISSDKPTIRIGVSLHLAVVTLKLPPERALKPNQVYSYNLQLTDKSGKSHDLKSLRLLDNETINGKPHLCLGYVPKQLPSFALPPTELTQLRLIHGSCRRPGFNSPDGLAWVDDLILESRNNLLNFALNRPHQLMLTGDQIYADDLMQVQLMMVNDLSKQLIGSKLDGTLELIPLEELAVGDELWPADLVRFPVGQRERLIREEARMTTTDAHSHLMSFGEYCALYLLSWSNGCWPERLPAMSEFLPPFGWLGLIPSKLEIKVIPPEPLAEDDTAGIEKKKRDYANQAKLLTDFQETLPKVRRALANTPTYMMFDDHDVTDDWYLNPLWNDRVLTTPLGRTIVRNGLLSYALFQGWGNNPIQFEEGAYQQLLQKATEIFPDDTTSGPLVAPVNAIDTLLGLDQATGLAGGNPPVKWHYAVKGAKHLLLALDNRTRRSYVSRVGPPGNVSIEAQADQIPASPLPAGIEVVIVIAPLPVIAAPVFDELLAPVSYRVFDLIEHNKLQKFSGSSGMTGTNPDAIEAWSFDPITFEALLKRLEPYRHVVFLSGDVHHGTSNALSYWKKGDTEPARFAQLTASGFKNVMPWYLGFIDRSFAFMQKLLQAKLGAERIGWNRGDSDLLRIPADATLSPALRAKLRREPVMIATEGWPADTTINPNQPPDWSWRVEVARDQRSDAQRPKQGQPDPLGVTDVTPNLAGYRTVAQRHASQLEKLIHARQILFASNLGLVTFQKRNDLVNGQQQVILDVIHALYTVHPNAADPKKPEPYTLHVIPLRAPKESRPEEKLR